jgi:hypothetical protein
VAIALFSKEIGFYQAGKGWFLGLALAALLLAPRPFFSSSRAFRKLRTKARE